MFVHQGRRLPLDTPFMIEREPTVIEHPAQRIEHKAMVQTGVAENGDAIFEEQISIEVVPERTETIDDSVRLPANWLRASTAQDRAAFDIEERADPVRPDDRLYIVNELEDGTFEAAARPIAYLRDLWLADIASRRWTAEIAGTSFAGMRLSTDATSQGKLSGAVLAALLDEAYTVQWKAEGGFVTLGKAQLIAAAQAVRAHVQACFDREADLVGEVASAQGLAELQAIAVNAGWPG